MKYQFINDYKLLKILGEGSYGQVYLAEGPNHNNYALKLIPIKKQNKESFRQEGIFLTSMNHKNILWARQFFYFNKQNQFVIITDYCKDGSLDQHIGKLSQDNSKAIMIGIAEGIKYLHKEKQLIHRDLKPQNIFLDDNQPKIGDLGIAKVMKSRAYTIIGTPFYMAFEMMEGDYFFEADIWAMGIIFLQMSLGKRIYDLLKGQGISSKRQSFPQPELLQKISNIGLRDLIQAMLQKDVKKRASIEQVLDFLTGKEENNKQKFQEKRRTIDANGMKKDAIDDCYAKTQQFWYCQYSQKYLKQLYQNNLLAIEEKAEEGNRKAQYLLGRMYQMGYGMPLNKAKAKEWLLKAYAQEQPHSCYDLLSMENNELQKKHYLKNGVDFKEVRCMYKLAENHLQGLQGYKIDYDQAYSKIVYLCQNNYPKAFKLKGKLQSKKSTQFYKEDSIINYKKGADLGDRGCMLALANRYLKQEKYDEALQLCDKIQNIEQVQKQQVTLAYECKAKIYEGRNQIKKAIQYYQKCIDREDSSFGKDYKGDLGIFYYEIKQPTLAILSINEAINSILQKKTPSSFEKKRLQELCQILFTILVQQKNYKDALAVTELSIKQGHQDAKADQIYLMLLRSQDTQKKKEWLHQLKKLHAQNNSKAQLYIDIISKNRQ